MNEHATWILSANQKQYEVTRSSESLSRKSSVLQVTFISEIGTFCEELLGRLSEIGIGRLPGTRVAYDTSISTFRFLIESSRVLPLTYAIGYSTFSPPRSMKVPTLSSTSLKPTMDYAPKITRVYSKVASPLLLPTR